MQTLTNYQYLDKDLILQGVYDWLMELSEGVMDALAVREVQGNGIKYNVRSTRPAASWLGTNDTIEPSSGTYTQRSASITRLLADIDVDKFAIRTNSTQNPELIEMKEQLDGFYHEWYTQLIFGQTTTSSANNQPKGLLKLIAEIESEATTDLDGAVAFSTGNNTQVVANHATSGPLTLANLDAVIDTCKAGATHLMMTAEARRKINALALAAGNNLEHDRNQLGYFVSRYGNQTILINEHIGNNFPNNSSSVLDISTMGRETTRTTDYDNTCIFALRLKENGFTILQAGAMEREEIGTVQNKDANRHRIKWYNGFGLFDKYSAAVLTGVEPSS